MSKERLEEYRNNITLHLTRMSSDIEHIKEKVNDTNDQLKIQNGRIRKNEVSISWVKGVGSAITFVIGSLFAWLGIEK